MGYVLSRYLTITYNTHTHNTNTSGTIKSNIKGIAQSTICSVAFNQKRGTLAVGTRSGHLLMWKFLGFVSSSTTGPKSWSLVYHTKLCSLEGGSAILQLQWAQRHLLSVRTESSRTLSLNLLALGRIADRITSATTCCGVRPLPSFTHMVNPMIVRALQNPLKLIAFFLFAYTKLLVHAKSTSVTES